MNLWSEKGFTIVELLTVLVVLSIILGIIYTSLILYKKQSNFQNDIIILDEDAKSAIYLLTSYIQMAGFGTSYSIIENNQDVNGFNTVITPADNDADGSDKITIVFANRFIGYVADNDITDSDPCYCSNTIYLRLSNQSKINLLDTDNKSYIFIDRSAYNMFYKIINPPSSASVPSCGSSYCYSLTIGAPAKGFTQCGDDTRAYVCDNDSVYAVRAVTFFYDPNEQEIEMTENVGDNPSPILSNVETFQIQYGIDRDDDGNFDDTDHDGNPLDDTFSPDDEKYIKLIKIQILLRTRRPDKNYKDDNSTYQIANYTINLDTNDSNGINSKYDWHYRRKLIELNIVPRNIIYEY